jgi:histidinol-phosphatase (PHP family)
MMPYSYHVHTNFSCDCDVPMEAMCDAALKAGLAEVGFSDHFDVHPKDPCAGYFRPEAWWETFRRCRDEFGPLGLALKAGIEIGESHIYRTQAEDMMARYEWDFVLGSLHWTGDESLYDEDYFRRTPKETVYTAYFEELVEMCQVGQFDILAHADIVKYLSSEVYGGYDPHEWEPLIRAVWSVCVARGIAIEMNAGTLRRRIKEPSPTRVPLGWYRELGGEYVTYGSDAHFTKYIDIGADHVLEEIRAAGFNRLTKYAKRQPSWVAID